MKTVVTSFKSPSGAKSVRKGNGVKTSRAGKASKQWRFAPDAIGMFNGPRDLSRRRGLSG